MIPFVIAVFLLSATVLLALGTWLAFLGGSVYYLIAGFALFAVAVEVLRRRSTAIRICALLLLASLVWAIAEAGLYFPALMSRLAFFAALSGLLTWPGITARLKPAPSDRRLIPSAIAMVLLTLFVSFLFDRHGLGKPLPMHAATDGSYQWQSFGGGAGGSRYAPLAQINVGNIDSVERAWVYRTGHGAAINGTPAPASTFQATPLQIGGQLVFCTPFNVIISVNNDTGKEQWRFDPKIDRSAPVSFVCRGVAYHAKAGGGACSQRILLATLDNRLLALDLHTGQLCPGFGEGGIVDLAQGLGKFLPGYHTVTSPPTIINGVAVVGSFVMDNQSVNEPSGVVRGYDVSTGKLLWAWDALSPWALKPGQSYTRGSPNSWSIASADPALNLVYLPMGGGTPDFFAGPRTGARDRYGSSITALDARTGNVRWSFQTVHHDVWDFDVASQPVLLDFPVNGSMVPALAAPTKRGEIFILDRNTGRPLVPVQERPVPGSGAPEERLAKTQPFVSGFPTFAPLPLRESSMWGVTPFDQLWCRIAFRRARYDGPFTPPTVQGTIVHTGPLGGFNWGSVSIDPKRGLLIGNFNWLPYIVKLIPRKDADAAQLRPASTVPGPRVRFENGSVSYAQAGLPYAAKMSAFISPLGFPCSQPPWGLIGSIDLKGRSIRWMRPLGTTRDLAPLGISLPLGPPNIGGAITTEGGLTFVGAAMDDYIRAFDSATGAELWRRRLPAGGQATPMTYVSPTTGRQYVVLAAGGHASLETRQGDYLIAYALPK